MANKHKTKYTKSSSIVFIIYHILLHKELDIKQLQELLQVADITLYNYIEDINLTFREFDIKLLICKVNGLYKLFRVKK